MPLELIVMPEGIVERSNCLLVPDVIHRHRDVEDFRDEVRWWG